MDFSFGIHKRVGNGEKRQQLVFCWSNRKEAERLGLGEQRKEKVCGQPTWIYGRPIISYSSLYPSYSLVTSLFPYLFNIFVYFEIKV